MAESIEFFRIVQHEASFFDVIVELENSGFRIIGRIYVHTRKGFFHVPFHVVV